MVIGTYITANNSTFTPNLALAFRDLTQLSIIIQDVLSQIQPLSKGTRTQKISDKSKVSDREELNMKLARWETHLSEDLRWHRYSATPEVLHPHIASLQ